MALGVVARVGAANRADARGEQVYLQQSTHANGRFLEARRADGGANKGRLQRPGCRMRTADVAGKRRRFRVM